MFGRPQVELDPDAVTDLGVLCEIFLPSGGEGPGAVEAGVVVYLLRALAGPWGQGERMYRQGPFLQPDHPGHGWQSALTPTQIYSAGLEALRRHCQDAYGAAIVDLDESQLQQLMRVWAAGTINTFEDVPCRFFFEMVKANVAEGLFSDPSYGGNRDMAGWRWLGYPGVAEAHGGYADHIGRHEAPAALEPRDLSWS